MSGDKLESLKDMPAPPPSEAARAKALAAAMAAFDAAGKKVEGTPQENAAPTRLTHASTQTQRSRLMRANYFHYKIAASIAVLVLAVPMSLYMYKQEMRSGAPVLQASREVGPVTASTKTGALASGKPVTYERLTPEGRTQVVTTSKGSADQGAAPAFPRGERSIYERLASESSPHVSPDGRSLEDRIDEALKRAQGAGNAPPVRDRPIVMHSEAYKPDGTRVDSRPVITPNVVSVDNGLRYPFGAASAPAPAAPAKPAPVASAARPHVMAVVPAPASPPPAVLYNPAPSSGIATQRSDFGWALLKEQSDQTQVFRFGAAPSFGGQPSAKPAAPAQVAAATAPKTGDTAGLAGGFTGGLGLDAYAPPAPGSLGYSSSPEEEKENRDQFEAFASNVVKQVAVEPVSTFSIDVDTASYGFVRRSLLAGRIPPKDAVRIEEMINYFPYAYPRPETAATPFQPTVTVMPAPWKPTNKLMHIGIKGYDIAAKERPRANLVLLIDVSGSMAPENRLPLLKNAFRMLLGELQPDDTVGIVTYASHSGVALEPTRVAERGKIADVLGRLSAGGSTAGGEGLQNAYRLAEMHFDKNAVNRIILATDGDFNVGISDHEQLKRFIEAKRQSGIFLSVIGVGQDNYNDRLMQALAQNGNGVAAYVDTLNEARKVLVDEASSSLFPIANDVKIQIEFNPAQVSEYRLIGYETRTLKREDFNNDKVDAGDIGSGHTVTAIYEVTPVGAPKFVDDLRYQKPQAQPASASAAGGNELAFLKIRYKLPGEETSKLIATEIAAGTELRDIQAAPEDVRFSIAVAAFGQMLRGEPFTGGYSFDDVIALAQTARGADPFGYRAEFLNIVRLAKSARQ
jgi:Ca-activated chloride channel family protein